MAESIIGLLLVCFYFILPAYFANMAPVIVKRVNIFNFPLDFDKKINNKPIFGKNKTFRGLVFGVLFAIIISFSQFLFYNNGLFVGISIVDYSNWLLIGILLGFGAIFGDLIESFVKRRLDYGPGKSFIPFDQIDFVLGALIFISFIVDLTLNKIIIIIVLSFVLHIIVNHIAFYTGMRNEKW